MAIAYFSKNTTFSFDGRAYQLMQEISTGLWQVQEVRTGRFHEFNVSELQQYYADGKLVFEMNDDRKLLTKSDSSNEHLNNLNKQIKGEEWEKAKIKRAYAKAIEDLPCTEKVIKKAIQEVWEKIKQPEIPPHWVSVCAWKKKYITYGKDAFSLASQHQRKGNRTSRFPKEVVAIAEECIDRIYMRRERETVEATVEEAIVMVERENKQRPNALKLPRPTRRFIQRLINNIPKFDRDAARYGRVAANRLYRGKLGNKVTKKPLESAEIDHTKLDLFVIDDNSHFPLGRPWLTICIDSHTRCILGIYIGFEPPSFLTVGKCLKHAFLPKVDLQKQYPKILHTWDAHGVMEQLIVDNGLEFHSVSLEKACLEFGVEIIYTPRRTPWYKGKIERFNGTLNKGISHGISGTTFSNIFEKDDYDPSKHAVVTLSTLRLIIHKWIADCYHQKPHRSLDMHTPAAFWASSIHPEDIALAHNPMDIDMHLGKAVEDKKVTGKGIEINKLLYNSPELLSLRHQYGPEFKAEIRVDESNVGHIYVILKDNQGYIEVPALKYEYANGLTLWLHNVCRNYAEKNFEKSDIYNYARAKTEIREIVEEEFNFLRKKSRKTNSRVARYNDTNQQSSAKSSAPETAKISRKKQVAPSVKLKNPVEARARRSYAPIVEQRTN